MAKNGQNWAQNEVFGHFLEIASLDFPNFAYNDRQAWYLTGYGGLSRWKKYFGQILAKIGQILAPKYVNGHFLEIVSLVFANNAYEDKQAWYLSGDGGPNGCSLKSSLFCI